MARVSRVERKAFFTSLKRCFVYLSAPLTTTFHDEKGSTVGSLHLLSSSCFLNAGMVELDVREALSTPLFVIRIVLERMCSALWMVIG